MRVRPLPAIVAAGAPPHSALERKMLHRKLHGGHRTSRRTGSLIFARTERLPPYTGSLRDGAPP